MEYCAGLALGGRTGWRLPAIEVLASLLDPTNRSPALPSGHPFLDMKESYWSSSSYIVDNNCALVIHMPSGQVGFQYPKGENNCNAWPVHG